MMSIRIVPSTKEAIPLDMVKAVNDQSRLDEVVFFISNRLWTFHNLRFVCCARSLQLAKFQVPAKSLTTASSYPT